MNGTATVATLQLSGDYSGASFAVASDGHGGANITVSGAAAGRFAQAISSMAPEAAGRTGHLLEAWRSRPSMMLAGPSARMA
jgi:hypothetical protein